MSLSRNQFGIPAQDVIGDGLRAVKSRKTLRDISARIERLYDVLSIKYDFVSPSTVKEYYLAKKKFTYSLPEIITAFKQHRLKLYEQGSISKNMLGVDANYCRHIKTYFSEAKINRPVEIPDTAFQDFYDWMIDTNRSGERFARKVCAFIRQILKWAIKKKLSPSLIALAETIPGKPDSEDDLDTTHLSVVQLQKLLTFDFNILAADKKLQQLLQGHLAKNVTHLHSTALPACITVIPE
jgi:hypothetical protein